MPRKMVVPCGDSQYNEASGCSLSSQTQASSHHMPLAMPFESFQDNAIGGTCLQGQALFLLQVEDGDLAVLRLTWQ